MPNLEPRPEEAKERKKSRESVAGSEGRAGEGNANLTGNETENAKLQKKR